MHAMILAAGLGTRLRPYSNNCPKPLFPVLGQPLLLHTIRQLRNSGCRSITINVHYLSDRFPPVLAGEGDVVLQVESEVLGTGGGLRKALTGFGQEPVLVVNGDIVHSFDLASIYSLHRASSAPVSMVVQDRPGINNLRISGEDKVTALRVSDEQLDPGSGDKLLAFAGIHVIDPVVLEEIPAEGFYVTGTEGPLLEGELERAADWARQIIAGL